MKRLRAFAQTYDNWDLWLVDDGSTDASAEIARRFANQQPEKVRFSNALATGIGA